MVSELEQLRAELRRVRGRLVLYPCAWELFVCHNLDNVLSGGNGTTEQIISSIRLRYPLEPTADEAFNAICSVNMNIPLPESCRGVSLPRLRDIVLAALNEEGASP